jgi:hypothetical protein
MNNAKEITEETIRIPVDMSIDVLVIIVKEKLKHEIIEVIENRSLIIIEVWYEKNTPKHQNVLYEIRTMLEDYNNFRFKEAEKVNWR